MERFTIVGGRGFIGAALAEALLREGHVEVSVVSHQEPLEGTSLGHVVYASGIAASAAPDGGAAFSVHVDAPGRILAGSTFESFLYLSSTRVYGAAPDTREATQLAVAPADARDVYRISKIAGEALCLAHPHPGVRVVRLSNVTGTSFRSPLFLSDVLRQVARERRAVVHTTRDSSKDYITVGDVCRYLAAIAVRGTKRIYNVATGTNIQNGAIYDALEQLGAEVVIQADAQRADTPRIDVGRLQSEFGATREDVLASLPTLLRQFVSNAEERVT